jgi:phosphomannomutase
MYSHFFFDLDDTLTESRTTMVPHHIEQFLSLCFAHDVIVISGAQDSQMQKQIPASARGLYYRLTQNGNHAVAPDGSILWSERFTNEQETAIDAFITEVHDALALTVKDESNLVEHRGSQISYSLIGHDEDREIKKAFDPDASKRKAILVQHAQTVAELEKLGIEITAGGTTCFDIFQKGMNKGYHVQNLITKQGWNKGDCIYVGDAIEPGRNDESVIGVIETYSVKNPDDTFAFIDQHLTK